MVVDIGGVRQGVSELLWAYGLGRTQTERRPCFYHVKFGHFVNVSDI